MTPIVPTTVTLPTTNTTSTTNTTTTTTTSTNSEKKKYRKAIYDYEAAETEEMTFQDGDIIEVLNEEQDSDWVLGLNERTGKKGTFPVNFTEPFSK